VLCYHAAALDAGSRCLHRAGIRPCESRSGLIALLHRLGLEYHKPNAIPRKLDEDKQKEFIGLAQSGKFLPRAKQVAQATILRPRASLWICTSFEIRVGEAH
jgi:hypothetical protein